jgi:DNA (cytosine-5)-methyltransferase 1
MPIRRPRALDLFCGAGGMSYGLELAGFEVTAVDIQPIRCRRGGTFVQADALEYPLERGFDLIHASPPCQAYSSLRHINPGKAYPDLIAAVRERLVASGALWCIENVTGAPLVSPPGGSLVMLCGTMFGLQTPDGRAEIRRHRLFETSWSIALRPACQHGYAGAQESLSVVGRKGLPGLSHQRRAEMERRRALSVTGHSYHTVETHPDSRRKVLCVAGGKAMSGGMMTPPGELKRRSCLTITSAGCNKANTRAPGTKRETFSIEDARAAMGIDWMSMKYLSQAIPPAYGRWIGERALEALAAR